MPAHINVEAEFADALRQYGILPHPKEPPFIADGKLRRFRVDGDKSGSKNGWYVLWDDSTCPAGAFGSWKTGVQGSWSAKSEATMSTDERDAYLRRQRIAAEARELEQARLRLETRERAKRLWEKAVPARSSLDGDGGQWVHPYLIKKGIRAYGLRTLRTTLVIPIRNVEGHLMSLQFIAEDGSKKNLTGGELQGGYLAIGRPEGTLCIAEGVATASTIRQATDFAVAAAFSSNNLVPVAKALRAKLPAVDIIICADNDQFTDGNPGMTWARKAAEACGGRVIEPIFEEQELSGRPTDFNDYAQLRGLEAVKERILNCTNDVVVTMFGAKTKKDLHKRIEETDDFDELTEVLAGEVNDSGLPRPAREFLLSLIAKKAGVPKSSLTLISRKPPDDDRNHKDPGPGLVRELNRKHAIVPVSGRTLVVNREVDPVADRPYFSFSDRTSFENRYCNRVVWHHGEDIPLGKFWMESPERLQYDGLVFLPGEDIQGYLNLWQGWGVSPGTGSCRQFLDFLHDVVCDEQLELYTYILDWSAHLVQRPAELPETSIVLRGREGIGKNTFADMLMRIVGKSHALLLSSISQVTGRFSGHLANALLVFCNESVWGGDKSAQGVLKSMITDDSQPIEYKGQDLVMMRSYKRMVFAANESWCVPRGEDDRRYVIADVSDRHKRDWRYFAEIRAEMDRGGVEGFMGLLLERDIRHWHPRQVPDVILQQGWDLKIETGSSVLKWWFDILQRGWLLKHDDAYSEEADTKFLWPAHLPVEQVQRLYLRWCDDYRITYRHYVTEMSRELHAFGVNTGRPRGEDCKRPRQFFFPAIEDARRIFSERLCVPMSVWQVPERDRDGKE
jgi:putative DNA primase/helicase